MRQIAAAAVSTSGIGTSLPEGSRAWQTAFARIVPSHQVSQISWQTASALSPCTVSRLG